MIHVIVVDDHALFRLGAKSALNDKYFGISVVGEAESGTELFGILKTTHADIVLLDISLPDMSGIEIARRLRDEYPLIKILVISIDNTVSAVQALMNVGINGFISKRHGSADELPEAIHTIMDGFEYYGKDISRIIYDIYVSKEAEAGIITEFTKREKEIIALCRNGLMSKEIASHLKISPRTVDTHKNNIFKKIGINNSIEMVQYALKHGIITLE